jgi:hypothetical protein
MIVIASVVTLLGFSGGSFEPATATAAPPPGASYRSFSYSPPTGTFRTPVRRRSIVTSFDRFRGDRKLLGLY